MGALPDETTKKIRDDIFCETAAAFRRAGFTDCAIAREYKRIAFSDISDYLIVSEGGELQAIPLDQIKNKKTRAIKKIREKTTITESSDGSLINKTSTVEYELYDKLSALSAVSDILGIKKPKQIEHSGKISLEDLVAGDSDE